MHEIHKARYNITVTDDIYYASTIYLYYQARQHISDANRMQQHGALIPPPPYSYLKVPTTPSRRTPRHKTMRAIHRRPHHSTTINPWDRRLRYVDRCILRIERPMANIIERPTYSLVFLCVLRGRVSAV